MDPNERSLPRGRRMTRPFLAAIAALTLLAAALPGTALGVGEIHEHADGYGTIDLRTGSVAPSAAQRSLVSEMDATVRWNRFGTPQSLIRDGGFLAKGLAGRDAATAARRWIASNKALFRLNGTGPSSLELLNDAQLAQSQGHAVIFRQRFGDLPSGVGGLITVGLSGTRQQGWKVAYVSSSAAGTQAAPAAPTLSARAAWRAAAADVGESIPAADLTGQRTVDGWTMFDVAGLADPARARLVAVPRPGQTVRPAWETVYVDVHGGHAEAYVHFVDAINGSILVREDRVKHLAQDHPESTSTDSFDAPTTEAFNGQFDDPGAGDCGPFHGPYSATAETISIVAVAESPGNDIILNLHRPQGTIVASSDIPFGPNPEVLTYEPGGGVPAGDYFVQICPFSAAEPAPPVYAGTITVNDAAGTSITDVPRWRFFKANPPLGGANTDTRILACWDNTSDTPVGRDNPLCQLELKNLAARAPWDFSFQANGPTYTTLGNAASTAESWFSPLTPGEQYRPVFSDRQYDPPWTDAWRDAKCDPATFGPTAGGEQPIAGGNDIDAAIVNLFSEHNRMHDFSYFLGFTESNYNMQVSNLGNGGEEGDPEIGNAQAGAVDGGFPDYLGRDNANQITLQDGIPGITNMYLWQPIAAGFYSPCVDGSFDQSVIGHEYTHAISIRMVGGPDGGISSAQGGAMGESWSDLVAVEYLNSHSYVPTANEHPFSVGAYVTGSRVKGIRNYNMTASPLNYGNVGYDFACNASLVPPPLTDPCLDGRQQVHADGEIWSAVNYDIRAALNRKYDSAYPSTNKALQLRCSQGITGAEPPQTPLNPKQCPGNRRWIQLVFDAFLMLQSDLNMLDARDAMLAADLMRFNGANQTELWRAFAKRGFGQFASSGGGGDADPVPSFQTPRETNESRVRFFIRGLDEGGVDIETARIFAGRYEAGATPIADTIAGGPLREFAHFTPGTYEFIVQAPGYGHLRFSRTIPASGRLQITVNMPTNHASLTKGGTVSGDGINKNKLIDDTEATNWAVLDRLPSVRGADITVEMAGASAKLVDRVRVSAMLRPRDLEDPGDDPEDPGENVGDTEGQSRFSALRSFRIQTCNDQVAGSICEGAATVGYTTVGTFVDAFPADKPRPRAPDLQIREFNVQDSMATHVRLVVLHNQCTAPNTPYQGDQDNDPLNDSDCNGLTPLRFGENQGVNLRAAELQVISGPGSTSVYEDPVVALTLEGDPTADQGDVLTYTSSFTNLGPRPASNARLVVSLPPGVVFRSASGGVHDAARRTVTWNLGTVGVGATGDRSVAVRVGQGTSDGTVLLTTAKFTAPMTVATPAGTVTVVQ